MAAPAAPSQIHDPTLTMLRIGAVASVIVSGTLALLAFIFGSPLEFGVAVAIGAGWFIADDLVMSMLKRERVACRPAVRALPRSYGQDSLGDAA